MASRRVPGVAGQRVTTDRKMHFTATS